MCFHQPSTIFSHTLIQWDRYRRLQRVLLIYGMELENKIFLRTHWHDCCNYKQITTYVLCLMVEIHTYETHIHVTALFLCVCVNCTITIYLVYLFPRI